MALDPAVVAAAKAGDMSAFTALVVYYHPRCLRFARLMLRDTRDAEEAVQDAFVRAHRALPRYREQERFDAWLFRILANRCRTMHLRRKRRSRFFVLGDPAFDLAATQHTADADAWRDEIRQALDKLTPAQREVFLLHHVEGLSYEEISAITGAGLSALKMRVKRACDFLRVRLRELERA